MNRSSICLKKRPAAGISPRRVTLVRSLGLRNNATLTPTIEAKQTASSKQHRDDARTSDRTRNGLESKEAFLSVTRPEAATRRWHSTDEACTRADLTRQARAEGRRQRFEHVECPAVSGEECIVLSLLCSIQADVKHGIAVALLLSQQCVGNIDRLVARELQRSCRIG